MTDFARLVLSQEKRGDRASSRTFGYSRRETTISTPASIWPSGSEPRVDTSSSSVAVFVGRMAVNHKVRRSNPRGGYNDFLIVFCSVKNGVCVGMSVESAVRAPDPVRLRKFSMMLGDHIGIPSIIFWVLRWSIRNSVTCQNRD